MIDKIELSISSRARCNRCNKRIMKEMPRGQTPFGRFLCNRCSQKELREQLTETKELIKQLSALIKEKQKELILEELE